VPITISAHLVDLQAGFKKGRRGGGEKKRGGGGKKGRKGNIPSSDFKLLLEVAGDLEDEKKKKGEKKEEKKKKEATECRTTVQMPSCASSVHRDKPVPRELGRGDEERGEKGKGSTLTSKGKVLYKLRFAMTILESSPSTGKRIGRKD